MLNWKLVRAILAASIAAGILIGAAVWSLSDPEVRKEIREGLWK